MRHKRLAVSALLVFLLTAPPSFACGFAEGIGAARTLREEAAESKLILYGRLANPRKDAQGGGSTDFIITSALKPHPALGGLKMLTFPAYVPIKDLVNPPRYLVFCDVSEGKIEPQRGELVGPEAVGYLKGLLALDAKDRVRLLRYCFNFLDHARPEIAADAFLEFMKSADSDIGRAARTLPPERLRGWLKDPKTPPARLRLYGFLLGNCGGDADAVLLRGLAEKLTPQELQIDGILTGYTLLKPRDGWAYVRALLGNPANSFSVRWNALRVARFFHNTRPDVIGNKEILDVLAIALSDAEIADFPIGYLREWRCWDLTARILPLYGKASHDVLIIRHNIIRYALQCPRQEDAAFVARLREVEPQLVTDLEESLK